MASLQGGQDQAGTPCFWCSDIWPRSQRRESSAWLFSNSRIGYVSTPTARCLPLSQEIAQASNDLYIIIRSLSSSAIAPLVQICIAVAVLATNRNVIMAGMISVYVALFLANHRVQGRKLSELRRGLMGAGRRTYATLVDSISNIHVARQTRRHFGAANRSLRKSTAPVDFGGSAGAASAVDVSAGRALRA